MAAFPGAIATFAGFVASHTLSVDNHAAQHNLEQAEIEATQTKLGTGTSTPANNTVLRGNGVGTSTWDQVHLPTDVTSLLSTSNGGNGTSTTTGNGAAAFGTAPNLSDPAITGGGSWSGSPVLSTPQIADLSNSQHNHSNGVGGGTLNGANALQTGSVNFANLLSSIFSSQITTYSNPGSAGGTNSLFYLNLGGIKLFWGTTAPFGTGTTADITFPVGFFSSMQEINLTPGPVSGTAAVVANISGVSITTLSINLEAYAGSGTMPVQVFAIGS